MNETDFSEVFGVPATIMYERLLMGVIVIVLVVVTEPEGLAVYHDHFDCFAGYHGVAQQPLLLGQLRLELNASDQLRGNAENYFLCYSNQLVSAIVDMNALSFNLSVPYILSTYVSHK